MKSAVETLNPTRVRLTVEVPFEELKPSLDAAYKKINQQVSVPGFRKGKVPARVIDQRFGRGLVLEEAVNEALPRFYGQAVEDNKVQVLGQPEVDVTEFADGAELKFTAEVEIRPEIELPDYEGVEVTVDDAEVTDEDIDKQLDNLRDRFAVLTGVDRPAQEGDYVSIDLKAVVDGEEVEDGNATGVSYEVGSGSMLEGLDEAVSGLSTGESATFTAALPGGAHAGEEAEVTATVRSVKVKELPELDDEFAQSASEFDTIAELRDDLRSRLERMKKYEQIGQARDRVLEALLELVDVPLPEKLLTSEIEFRTQSFDQQLAMAGMTRQAYLAAEKKTPEEFQAEIEDVARKGMKTQFVLDALSAKEQLSVNEAELTQHLVQRAAGSDLSPDQFAQRVVQSGQVPMLVGEVVRSKALALVLESAKIVDASGRAVDLGALEAEADEDIEAEDIEIAEAEAGEEAAEAEAAVIEAEELAVEAAEAEEAGEAAAEGADAKVSDKS